MFEQKNKSLWFNIDLEKIKQRIEQITNQVEATLRHEKHQSEIHGSYRQSSDKE